MSLRAQESRVDAAIRLAGLIVFAFGAVLAYLTYNESVHSTIVPQIVPVFYMISFILIFSGLLALVAKFK